MKLADPDSYSLSWESCLNLPLFSYFPKLTADKEEKEEGRVGVEEEQEEQEEGKKKRRRRKRTRRRRTRSRKKKPHLLKRLPQKRILIFVFIVVHFIVLSPTITDMIIYKEQKFSKPVVLQVRESKTMLQHLLSIWSRMFCCIISW